MQRLAERLLRDFAAALAAEAVPEDYIWLLDYLFTTVLDGRNQYVADGVQGALGRAPRDFREYALAAAATWRLGGSSTFGRLEDPGRPESLSAGRAIREPAPG